MAKLATRLAQAWVQLGWPQLRAPVRPAARGMRGVPKRQAPGDPRRAQAPTRARVVLQRWPSKAPTHRWTKALGLAPRCRPLRPPRSCHRPAPGPRGSTPGHRYPELRARPRRTRPAKAPVGRRRPARGAPRPARSRSVGSKEAAAVSYRTAAGSPPPRWQRGRPRRSAGDVPTGVRPRRPHRPCRPLGRARDRPRREGLVVGHAGRAGACGGRGPSGWAFAAARPQALSDPRCHRPGRRRSAHAALAAGAAPPSGHHPR